MSLPVSPSGRYLWLNYTKPRRDGRVGRFVPVEKIGRRPRVNAPNVMSDIEPYKSPLGTGEISSRSHRREDLKRGGCREVDPSEWQPKYHSKRFAEKAGKEWTPREKPKGAEFGGLVERQPVGE